MEKDKYLLKATRLLDSEPPALDGGKLRAYVEEFLGRRDLYLAAWRQFGSPLYMLDEAALMARADEFYRRFSAQIPDINCFYAIKSNYHPFLIKTLIARGYGMDVSSGVELKLVLDHSPDRVIFSGPAKTLDELKLACAHADRVTVLIDSFGELERLQAVAAGMKIKVRAGVRLTVEDRGLWRKFGISLALLEAFLKKSGECPNVSVEGLQYHTSWNMDTSQHETFLKRLGSQLGALPAPLIGGLKFLDMGGGYWPPEGEWVHAAVTPEGQLRACLDPQPLPAVEHCFYPALPLEDFAGRIRSVLESDVFPHCRMQPCVEPGRWICHPSMHILLTVMDKKGDDLVIVDAGTNTVGWERYERDYFPVLNLTRPSLEEKPCVIYGSLCTPHDIWGFHYFGEDIRPGDILFIPDQGAYTYSLRQQFIKPLPAEVVLRAGKNSIEAYK